MNFSRTLRKPDRAGPKSCRLKRRNACSKARTAASVPGDGGFFGGAGKGFGASILRLASIALRDCVFESFRDGETFVANFFDVGLLETVVLLFLDLGGATTFFFGATFFDRPLPTFFAATACLVFLAGAAFLATVLFFDFGAAVILPGRFGFLVTAFFPLVARILFDVDKPLLVAFVIRLLISHLGVENEPALRLNPAHTLVYGLCLYQQRIGKSRKSSDDKGVWKRRYIPPIYPQASPIRP